MVRIDANEDAELQPGDAVEVTLRYQDGLDARPKAKRFKYPDRDRPTNWARDDSLRSGAGDAAAATLELRNFETNCN